MLPKLWVSWSLGKDSAFALYKLKMMGAFTVSGLLTTVNETFQRVAMHAVRENLLDCQAEELGLPVYKTKISYPCSDEIYRNKMAKAIEEAQRQGVTHIMFGDLFLASLSSLSFSSHSRSRVRAITRFSGSVAL